MAGEDFSQRASHDRLSAITDGVYAVALTLLALEIVVPSANSIHSSLGTPLNSKPNSVFSKIVLWGKSPKF